MKEGSARGEERLVELGAWFAVVVFGRYFFFEEKGISESVQNATTGLLARL